jgi:hypothetical protein
VKFGLQESQDSEKNQDETEANTRRSCRSERQPSASPLERTKSFLFGVFLDEVDNVTDASRFTTNRRSTCS